DAVPEAERLRIAGFAAAAGARAHLLFVDGEPGTPGWRALRAALDASGDPGPFASVTVLDPAAAARVRRIRVG
ncbi:MAG TPA: hypothetical protein VN213_14530, partial [Solirubrobacteraceae bacterium]|nr:hypothetical protein [Solirubrobacteraceae bacterium]